MQKCIESYCRERRLDDHESAAYDDGNPSEENVPSRMETMSRNSRGVTDEQIEAAEGGLIRLGVPDQDIVIRLRNVQLGEPMTKEANGYH